MLTMRTAMAQGGAKYCPEMNEGCLLNSQIADFLLLLGIPRDAILKIAL